MWPFQRKTQAPADSGSRPAPAPVIRRDWTGLPPIQRLIGAHPLTAPSDRFSDDLATHHDPSVSTEPMGHQVSAEAPSGIVLALARPTTRDDGPAMISRPRVQRRVQSAIEESGEWDGDEAASPATRPSPLPAGTPPSAMRELPAVAPAPVMQRLTALSADAEPIPVESAPRRPRLEPSPELPAMSHAEPPDAPMAAPPRLTLGQARRLGLGAPISRVPGRAVQRAIAETTEMPLAPSPVPQPSFANGEPLRADRSAAASDETATASPLDLPLAPREPTRIPQPDPPPQATREISGDSPMQRATDVSAEPPADRATETFTDAATPGRTEIAVNPVSALPLIQRSLHRELAEVAVESSAEPALPLAMPQRAPTLPSPASAGREFLASPTRGEGDFRQGDFPRPFSARGEGRELAPLVGTRPLRPTTLQRAPEPAPVATSAKAVDAQPSTRGDDLVLPSSSGSPDTRPARSRFGPALSHVAPQQQDGPTMPDQALPVGQRVEVQTQSERSVSRAAELPLAPLQRAAAAESPEQELGGESTSEVVQRGMFDSLSSEVSSLSSRVPSPAEAGSAVSTVGSAIGSMFGGHKAPETDMDELAGKLYDKIRTRLKSELLVDRERAGLLTDLR